MFTNATYSSGVVGVCDNWYSSIETLAIFDFTESMKTLFEKTIPQQVNTMCSSINRACLGFEQGRSSGEYLFEHFAAKDQTKWQLIKIENVLSSVSLQLPYYNTNPAQSK